MRIKPLILLFFVWLLWGSYVVYSVTSQSREEQSLRLNEKVASQGQVLQWFFQERTLALKSLKDDEPVVARYNTEDWKRLDPWKAVAYLKDRTSSLYGPFEKIMPEVHRQQLLERLKKSVPSGRIEGVHWEAFQWNGTPLVVAYVSRPVGTQAFVAQASDWGKSLSLFSTESGWSLVNEAGTYIFHSDLRYIGEARPAVQSAWQRELNLSTTNLKASLTSPKAATHWGKVVQVGLISLGFFLISWVITSQYLRTEKARQTEEALLLKQALRAEFNQALKEKAREMAKAPPQPEKQSLFFKDLSHRVAASLGRQLQPSFVSILGHSLWLENISKDRSEEEKSAIGAIQREARSSKDILDKLLSVAGESDLVKIPMKLETPVLRALRRWETQFSLHEVRVEKNIHDTSFYPLHSDAIEKALDHIFENALEAMTRQIDKSLKVSLSDDMDFLYLRVEDTGAGIEPGNLEKISDPFFTTKAHLSKLGLGLTEAFGLLKQHHAIVLVTSELGKGTSFEIRFDKNEAKRVIELSRKHVEEAEGEGRVVIPMDLPLPIEKAPETAIEPVAIAEADDQEIEKLLDIGMLDFIETVDTNEKQNQIDASDRPADTAELLDENPLRGPHA